MPKGENQKRNLYYIDRSMTEKTGDEWAYTDHARAQRYLEDYGVPTDHKSLYNDPDTFRVLEIDVIIEKDSRDYV